MKCLLWLTDLHLNSATPERFARLIDEIKGQSPDVVLIGGDTGEAPSFAGYLEELAGRLAVPIYFVLGNHDYFLGSINKVRHTARDLSRNSEILRWLPEAGVVPMTDQTVLIGHGGWGDGRCGDFLESDVLLNDYVLIDELRRFEGSVPRLSPEELLSRLNRLGDEAAEHFRKVLPSVFEIGRRLFVLTHVPPFREACWHQGQISDDNWLPHFTCQAVGHVLAEFMRDHPDHRMTVLCGHTHSDGRAQMLPNLDVITGGARYGEPEVQQVFEIGNTLAK